MSMRSARVALGTAALAVCATMLGAGPASAHDDHGSRGDERRSVTLRAHLSELNDSGASGRATVRIKDGQIQRVTVRARGLSPDLPHAQHIHYGQDALNECPGLVQDVDGDGRLTTLEGVPAYGPIAVSLTTRGDTSPASGLVVDRFPVSRDGRLAYHRSDLAFTDVAGAGAGGTVGSAADVLAAIRAGEGVVVIHGIDYDGNGTYSFSKEGASDLDPSLPAEATDPAVCGLLR